jgi:glycosyltransferase involved in cell wall biosynthesis
MKVLLRAPLLTLSGYGIHSRQVFEWLESLPGIELSVEILQWGATPWLLSHETDNGIVGRIMSKSKEILKGTYDYTFQVQLPDEWDETLGKRNIGISAFVETDRCSSKWIDKCNKMDAIIVPSTFTKTVALRSGVMTTPIHVVPEWYNEHIDNSDLKPTKLNLKSKFNFLMVGTITSQNADDDRKNIFHGIKWFCEQFKDDKKVSLVLKTSFGKGTKIDRKITTNIIKQVLQQVRPGKFPKVNLIHGGMTQEEIAGVYRNKKIHGLISPTRGEGYGLPLVEAAAEGLPIVATGWSGHNEFLQKDKYLAVDYSLEPISKNKIDNRVFVEGTRWAKVSENDFKRKIQDLRDNYDLHVKNSVELQSVIKSEFSKSSVIEKYNKFFNEFKKSIEE